MVDTCTVTATSRDFEHAVRPGDVFVFTPRLRQASGGIDSVYVPGSITATANEAGEISVELVPAQYYLTISGASDVRKASLTVPDAETASLGACFDADPTVPALSEFQELTSQATAARDEAVATLAAHSEFGLTLDASGDAAAARAVLEIGDHPTRAAFVAWAAGRTFAVGLVIRAGGYGYRYIGSGTAISDLPGWVPDGDITPDHFGGSRFIDAGPMMRAAAAYADAGGGSVLLTGGTYICTSTEARFVYLSTSDSGGTLVPRVANCTVFLNAGVSLIGPGEGICTIDASGTTGSFSSCIGLVEYTNGGIGGFTLIGPGATGNAAHGIHLSYLLSDTVHSNANIRLRRLHIKNWGSYGIGHQYGSPENYEVSDVIIENTGADGIDHKVRFGPGDQDDNAIGVILDNIIVRNFGQRITTSVAGIDVRGRAILSNIEVTGVPALCRGIEMAPGIQQGAEHRQSSSRSSLTNFYVEAASAADQIIGVACFSSGPMVVSNGYVRGAQFAVLAETATPFGYLDGPSLSNVTVEGLIDGDSFLCRANNTTLSNCKSISEKAYFDEKRGNLVAGQTVFVVTNGIIAASPIVLKNEVELIVSVDYTISGNTVTLTSPVIAGDDIVVVQPTNRPYRIEGTGCSIIGGGCDKYHTTTGGMLASVEVQQSTVCVGFNDPRVPTLTFRPDTAAAFIEPITPNANEDVRLVPKGTGLVRFGTYEAAAIGSSGVLPVKSSDGVQRKLVVTGNSSGNIGFPDIEGAIPIARRSMYAWLASAGAANISAIGTATLPTALGTLTTGVFSTANLFGYMPHVDYLVTVAAINAIAGLYRGTSTLRNATVGGPSAGLGGFRLFFRWGPSTGVSNTTHRAFVGMNGSTVAPTDVEPSSLINIVGMGWDAADANVQIMYNDGSGAATKIDLGELFPVPTIDATNLYELELYSPKGTSQSVSWKVTNIVSGASASGTISANLPATTTALAPQGWMSVGGTSSVVGFAFCSMQLDTLV